MPDPPRTFSPAITLGAAVIAAVVAWAAVNQLFRGDPDAAVHKALVAAADVVNKTCPRMIDSETRLDGTLAAPVKTFIYRYTLLNRTKADLSHEALAEALRPGIVKLYRTDPSMKTFRDVGVTAKYQYFDKNGVYLTEIVVRPGDL